MTKRIAHSALTADLVLKAVRVLGSLTIQENGGHRVVRCTNGKGISLEIANDEFDKLVNALGQKQTRHQKGCLLDLANSQFTITNFAVTPLNDKTIQAYRRLFAV